MTTVTRFEVRPAPGKADPRAEAILRAGRLAGLPLHSARSCRIYLIEAPLAPDQVRHIQSKLLADPVLETTLTGATPAAPGEQIIEVHPLPGVMDPAAQSVQAAIRSLLNIDSPISVSTGWRYDLQGLPADQAKQFAETQLANRVVQGIHLSPWTPTSLPHGHASEFNLRTIPIRDKSDDQLILFSREAHLFLSLEEMLAIRAEYNRLGRDPTDIELETIAQTWSEHCVHKTLKSKIRYRSHEVTKSRSDEVKKSGGGGQTSSPRMDVEFSFGPRSMPAKPTRTTNNDDQPDDTASSDPINWHNRPGHTIEPDGSITIDNLLKSTVAAATFELIEDGLDWTLSVFKDNSGVIAFDDHHGICIKVETHNRPSAIEPYGGAATGAGGCIRDVIGTGLGAKPIASTDIFCVAHPNHWTDASSSEISNRKPQISSSPLPPGTLHPRRILTEVVAGVRDYGNRMGIPTVAGAVHFDDRYVGNPLVYCGCIGLIPRNLVNGQTKPGDHIIALGGRTGRDGIHGATFSSAEVQHTHADEFAHAVQIGNAIEEKRVLDAILRARDCKNDKGVTSPLYNAMTDCGAGGFSSAIGEMGKDLGAVVHLDRAPLKYAGLTYTEIWISEAQERMVLAVPEANIPALNRICQEEAVELADLGTFGTPNHTLQLFYNDTPVGELSMHFLHEGIPQPIREAVWNPTLSPSPRPPIPASPRSPSVSTSLLNLLSHPTIASKHWIIRQYDHEVQGNTILKPLVGPAGRGPGNGAVIEPIAGSGKGLAIAAGLATGIGDPSIGGDPYQSALAGIDECIRNLVCLGANPSQIAILDNFCWPSCEKPENLGSLVRAAEGCYDGAKAYRTPFVSGKDSLNNQLRYTDPNTGEDKVIEIPPTLLISGIGIVNNIKRSMTMDAKKPGNTLMLIGTTGPQLAGSTYSTLHDITTVDDAAAIPTVNLTTGPNTARAIHQLIQDGLILSVHDCSDGGLLVALAEMLIAAHPGPITPSATPTSTTPAKAIDASAVLQSLLKPSLPALLSESATSAKSAASLGLSITAWDELLAPEQLAFSETPSRYIIEARHEDIQRIRTVLTDHGGIHTTILGTLNTSGRLTWTKAGLDLPITDLAAAWLAPLDW
ncbi:MAG: phosphoribosylformylglycinamidine synthase [Phycisphaerales bacterium]|nr:phosphoribosylformylglycinamidine synthase [Phycisphaerales bacterium]